MRPSLRTPTSIKLYLGYTLLNLVFCVIGTIYAISSLNTDDYIPWWVLDRFNPSNYYGLLTASLVFTMLASLCFLLSLGSDLKAAKKEKLEEDGVSEAVQRVEDMENKSSL